nr:unnamed protein product [Spirometra erinaceieuropaei]
MENLEKLLAETQKKSQLLEKQIREGLPSIGRPMLSENERKRLREIDLLRGQLEEKDEILEDQEGQLRDMKTRLERARKMNEAMKTLIDKEPAEQISVGKSVENKEVALEIASYRRELECTRKELAIVQQKLTQMERVREKLLIENKDLQEELKLREDSLFDQDDELEKRNAELAKLKRTLEQMKSELEESKTELSRIKTQESGSFSSKLSAVIADNEKLREELSAKVRGLGEISAKLAALESREKETSGRCERLSKELSVKESDLRERDVLLLEAKKEARKLADELGSVRKQDGETQQRVQQLEKTVNELNQKLQERESETTHLQPTVASVEAASPGLSRSPGWRTDSSPDSGIYVSDVGGGGGGRGSRDNTLSRRAELDRLRREVGLLREERDELARKARKDRQEFERRLAEVSGGRKSSIGGNSAPGVSSVPASPGTAAGTGDLYSRAIAERQMTTKLSLLNEHTTRQNRVIMEMKIQNESLQNKMLEYQRRYVNLKEQYDAEQDAWLSERVILESKAKEMRLPPVEETEKSPQQEDRKGVIMSTRKSLQEACIKLAEAEKEYERERQRLASEIERLENERAELKVQLAHLKDQQKMPKVLQRFGGSSSRSGQLPQLSASVTSAANSEAARRLEAAERTISKLRSELQSKTDNFSNMSAAAVKEAEAARHAAEQQMETMKEQIVQLVFYREQADLFRERLIEAERVAEREYKVWSDEREDLLYRIEDARICVEQWCLRLHHRENNELQTSDELVDEVVAEMERWRSSKLKAVAVTRRPSSRQGSIDSLSSIGDATQKPFSVPGKPPLRQPISPARRKFFDETASAAQQPETPQPPPPVVESVSKPETLSLPNPTIVSIAPEQKTRATSEKSSASPRSSKTKTVKSTPPESSGELRTAGREKSPSVISRLSSKFTGASGSGKSDSKSPSRKAEADKSKEKPGKPSTEKEPATKTPETMTAPPPPAPVSNEAGRLRRHSEAPSSTPLQQSKTPEFPSVTLKKTPVSTGISTTTTTTAARSSRSNSTGIAPSIMLLRQKFSGK